MSGPPDPAPILVTAALDTRAQGAFEALRRAHFPPGRARAPAHLTLFRALPGSQHGDLLARCRLMARGERAMPARLGLPFAFEDGVAYAIDCPPLRALHAALREAWWPLLDARDRAPFHPHISIANGLAARAATALAAALRAQGEGVAPRLTRLALWRWRGGPWEAAGRAPFLG